MYSNSRSNNESGNGIGILSILTIVFVILKLTGFINWHWFWVLSPTLIPLIIFVVGISILATPILIRRVKNRM